MVGFSRGQRIQIRCEAQQGAFPDEYLVKFETAQGPVSGFVRRDNISRIDGDHAYILATVEDVSDDSLTVLVRGSFFTTTGLARLSRDWANSHVRAAHAA